MYEEPQPGEVWIITNPSYGPDPHATIPDRGRPFIVTHISRGFIFYAYCDDDGDIVKSRYHRYPGVGWNWLEHAEKLWPPARKELGRVEPF